MWTRREQTLNRLNRLFAEEFGQVIRHKLPRDNGLQEESVDVGRAHVEEVAVVS